MKKEAVVHKIEYVKKKKEASPAGPQEETPAKTETQEREAQPTLVEAAPESVILSKDVKTHLTEEEIARKGFTSSYPWEDKQADCLVIACSDQRFRLQSLDFVKHLGFNNPHVIQFPSGLAAAHPLISVFGFLSKAVDKLLDKAIEATGAKDIICIAHEDCAAYKLEKVKLIDTTLRKFSGKSVRDIQFEHLQKAARRLQLALRGINVRTFYADVVESGSESHVNFKEIPLSSKKRKG